jgi:hypothetical protein
VYVNYHITVAIIEGNCSVFIAAFITGRRAVKPDDSAYIIVSLTFWREVNRRARENGRGVSDGDINFIAAIFMNNSPKRAYIITLGCYNKFG